jgi:hypothetical protein
MVRCSRQVSRNFKKHAGLGITLLQDCGNLIEGYSI